MVAIPSPPRRCPRNALAARNSSRLMPELEANDPISRNSGTTAKFQSGTVRMNVWPTILSAGPPPERKAKPPTPTRPVAMPTGTSSSITVNRTPSPMTATTSVLIAFASLDRPCHVGGAGHPLRLKDQPIRAHRDQQHGGDVAEPGDGEKGPGRQVKRERGDVGLARAHHVVEKGVGLDDRRARPQRAG